MYWYIALYVHVSNTLPHLHALYQGKETDIQREKKEIYLITQTFLPLYPVSGRCLLDKNSIILPFQCVSSGVYATV